jgi:hypothetical protein
LTANGITRRSFLKRGVGVTAGAAIAAAGLARDSSRFHEAPYVDEDWNKIELERRKYPRLWVNSDAVFSTQSFTYQEVDDIGRLLQRL